MNLEEGHGARWPGSVRRGLALLAGAVFVYTGGIKLIDPLRFASDVTNYDIIPWSLAIRLAFYLPWLELLCGLALIFHRLYAGALFLTGTLMLIFIDATVSARMRGIDISCGCFGSASAKLSFTWHLLLDLGLLSLLVLLWFWNPSRAAERLSAVPGEKVRPLA